MIMKLGCEGEETQRWDGFIYGIENEDDARLIAAAPDLLKTLIQICGELQVWSSMGTSRNADWPQSRIDRINKVISKIEGDKS